jgi:hypothetical protein
MAAGRRNFTADRVIGSIEFKVSFPKPGFNRIRALDDSINDPSLFCTATKGF